jgi:hypothetical protein
MAGALLSERGLNLAPAVAAAAPPVGQAAPVPAAEAVPAAAAQPKESAIVAYSAALDALDRSDRAEAVRQVAAAAAADGRNKAVRALFDKLVVPSPRYQPEVEYYAPLGNAAAPAFAERGTLAAWIGMQPSDAGKRWGEFAAADADLGYRVALDLPIGRVFAVSAETVYSYRASSLSGDTRLLADASDTPVLALDGSTLYYLNFGGYQYGARLGLAWRATGTWGFGVSAVAARAAGAPSQAFNQAVPSRFAALGLDGTYWGAAAAAAYRSDDGGLTGGLQLYWQGNPNLYLDAAGPGEPGAVASGRLPIVSEAYLTGRVPDSRLFAGLRGAAEWSPDGRGLFLLRAQPVLEWWPARWLSRRSGGELTLQASEFGLVAGGGAQAGASLELGPFELSANVMASLRPSRSLPGATPTSLAPFWLVGVAWHGVGARAR